MERDEFSVSLNMDCGSLGWILNADLLLMPPDAMDDLMMLVYFLEEMFEAPNAAA